VSPSFQRTGGLAAIAAGAAGLLYSLAFVLMARVAPHAAPPVYSLLLLTGGLLSSLALVALWDRLRTVISPGWALWALGVGLIAALGSAIHGGYDLANSVNPPASLALDTPNQVDPRGLLTFGFAGLAVAAFSLLQRAAGGWPVALVYIGLLSAALLEVIYLSRLLIPNSIFVLAPAALEGFVVNPVWYVWLGLELRRGG
jgi:hypothetical protein